MAIALLEASFTGSSLFLLLLLLFFLFSFFFFFSFSPSSAAPCSKEAPPTVPSSDQYKPETSASKLIANLLIMGSGILGRAVLQAYRKAIENASKNGVAHEAINNVRRASKTMTEQEARQVLGISENTTWEEVMQKYDVLFENNAKNGSFYLQSKVHRAKECLEAVYRKKNVEAS